MTYEDYILLVLMTIDPLRVVDVMILQQLQILAQKLEKNTLKRGYKNWNQRFPVSQHAKEDRKARCHKSSTKNHSATFCNIGPCTI